MRSIKEHSSLYVRWALAILKRHPGIFTQKLQYQREMYKTACSKMQ